MQKILYAIPDLCTGCNRCTYICSAVKEGRFHPSAARIHISNFSLEGYSVPGICFQCPKPDCLAACPQEAISRNENGVVVVDQEKCDGCGACVDVCPYGMIAKAPDECAVKCDYCGGDPACVRECFPGALVYGEEDKALRKLRALQMKQRSPSGSAEEKRRRLGLNVMAAAR
jgi:Fe-S-cluster-containing hydrogenase component 2